MGAVLKVKSTATSTPVLTLSNGGKLAVGTSCCNCFLWLLDLPAWQTHQDGNEIDGGIVRDVAR